MGRVHAWACLMGVTAPTNRRRLYFIRSAGKSGNIPVNLAILLHLKIIDFSNDIRILHIYTGHIS